MFDLFLALVFCALYPRILWQKIRRGKRFPTLKEWFGASPPKGEEEAKRIWIHAVSVGEVKAAQPLVDCLIAQEKKLVLLITTATYTGLQEARRIFSYPGISILIRILPLDFSWIMRRWVRSFRPHQLFFVEGDLWPNLLREAKRFNAKTVLISGKISHRSMKLFRLAPFLSRALFDRLDHLFVQNQEQVDRFAQLTHRPIQIGGNLKLDLRPQSVDQSAARCQFSLHQDQPVMTIACTHAPEEQELLDLLEPLWQEFPQLVLFLAPRHPERCEEIASFLKKRGLVFCRWKEQRTHQPLILVDVMGVLPICYSLSRLALIGGSFSSQVGGHNVLEPCLYGCPVFFGPYMHAQQELAQIVLDAVAGRQSSSGELFSLVREELLLPRLSCKQLYVHSGVAAKCLRAVFN